MIYQLRELPRYKTRTRGSHRNPLTYVAVSVSQEPFVERNYPIPNVCFL